MISLTIDGRTVDSRNSFGVVNPSTGAVFAQAPDCSQDELNQAVDAARRAFSSWQRSESPRREALARAAEIVDAHADELGRLVTLEQGKTLLNAVRETKGSAARFRYAAGIEIPTEVVHDQDGVRVEVARRPFGVVAAITPWNYPLIVAAGKVAAALRVGNTVVLKPSPFTPLATLRLGELLQEVLPPGVLNVVSGGDELGRALVRHPTVRKISFTGSTAAGRHILSAAAPDLKRTTLELGGNDAAVVLDDVDPAAVAPRLFWGAFQNSGQVCSAIKRLYVHERVYPELAKALTDLAATVRVGDGLDAQSEMGPVSTDPQFRRVTQLVEDARTRGGHVMVGGTPKGGNGYFYTPTLIEGLADTAPLVAEEQFGPVLPLMSFKDEDEAIERANATPFGLSASVWSGSSDRAKALTGRLEAGTVWVNQHLMVLSAAPISGHKTSGIGVEGGMAGFLDMTQTQSIFSPQT
jgi:acyl-CoA reductase-like NAD-dependent aldehyde dehydrogenase